MHTRARTVAAILGVLTVAGAACSPAEQSNDATPSATAPAPPEPEVPVAITPVLANVVSAPVPASATDGRTHLAYELALTNTLGQEVTLTSVTVRAGDQSLLTLSGDKLGYWTRVLGTTTATTQ